SAVLDAAEEAIVRARSGSGPSLIECKTYRFGVHAQRVKTRKDPRPQSELEAAMEKDPIAILKTHLEKNGFLTADRLAEIEKAIATQIDDAVEFGEKSPLPKP